MAFKRLYFSKFSGGACPRTPLGVLARSALVGRPHPPPPQILYHRTCARFVTPFCNRKCAPTVFNNLIKAHVCESSNLVSAILNVLSGTKNDIRDKKLYPGQKTISGTKNYIRDKKRYQGQKTISGTKNDIRDKKRYPGQKTISGTKNDIRVTYRFYFLLLST